MNARSARTSRIALNAVWSPIGAQIDPRRRNSQPRTKATGRPGREPDDDQPATSPEGVARGVEDVGQGEEQ